MKKFVILFAVFLISFNYGYTMPVNGTISRDYDFGFESVIKKKFSEIFKISHIFENNDDTFYNKGYKPLYMLSVKELYNVMPAVTTNIKKRIVPDTYNLSLSGKNVASQNTIVLSEKKKITAINAKNTDYDRIKSQYQTLLAQNPNRIELMYKYAQFLYANNKYNEAIAILNNIITKHDGFILASYTLGNIYFDMGEYKNAIKANLTVISKNPYCADAYFNIASALEKLQKFNLAIDYYQKCLSINVNDTQAQNAIKRLEQLTYENSSSDLQNSNN